jgi:hypothetical protein
MRPPRITAEEQSAFNIEIRDLRHAVKKLTKERHRFINPDRDPGRARLDSWTAQLAACRERLDYWDKVLTVDREIRSPVRLRDAWHGVNIRVELNEFEVRYFRHLFLGEPHPEKDKPSAWSCK